AVMLGQPYFMSIPEVIGVRMTGRLKPGITATDLVLTVTQMLRKHKVVEKFVEYFGPGIKMLTLPDRATVANMTPEYGATMGFFPVDEITVEYLRNTNRKAQAEIVEVCAKAMGLYYTGTEVPEYTQVLELDLSTIEPCLAGPARPQDRIALSNLANKFDEILGCEHERDADVRHISQFHDESGTKTSRDEVCAPSNRRMFPIKLHGQEMKVGDGSVVIAAITSCTNTSNPFVLLGAGLLAKKAVEKGLKVPAYVKTSLVPGSKVASDYLEEAGLMPYLQALGFHVAGFGCTTCIGNSGPLDPNIEKAIVDNKLTVAAVLSGNRNFEARIHQNIRANFLASPMLVVAFAIAGRMDIDPVKYPLTLDPNGDPVYLKDILPSDSEIAALMAKHVRAEFYENEYAKIFEGDEFWQKLQVKESMTYQWDDTSTYIRNPPYFEEFSLETKQPSNIENARALLMLGDSVTTDHISPAGAIPKAYPAGQYLIGKNVAHADFNSYGSRRGNHEVMMRGTFGNIRIKNKMVTPKEGSFTRKFPENQETYIYDAAMAYKAQKTPLLIFGGKEYGTGSSRDWAAKGTFLLGVKAVIAESFERIHRSNLVGMGVLPLTFKPGDSWEKLGLDGSETFSITGIRNMTPRKVLTVNARKSDGSQIAFDVISRLDTDIETEYFAHRGILPYVLRKLMK
ncbi:MAG: aconitate hydratase AcnA, partial [Desulfobacteraceae bacterium]|nr:aconitate hydratase AcnA [Desulfobacteraceae bacterium]